MHDGEMRTHCAADSSHCLSIKSPPPSQNRIKTRPVLVSSSLKAPPSWNLIFRAPHHRGKFVSSVSSVIRSPVCFDVPPLISSCTILLAFSPRLYQSVKQFTQGCFYSINMQLKAAHTTPAAHVTHAAIIITRSVAISPDVLV